MPKHKWFEAVINLSEEITETPQLAWNETFIKYAKWQLERGVERGKLHLQCFIEAIQCFDKDLAAHGLESPDKEKYQLRLRRIIKFKNDTRSLMEVVEDRFNYASKEDTRVGQTLEFGRQPKFNGHDNQGSRTDIQTFYDAMAAKRPLAEVIMDSPETLNTFCKYSKGLQEACRLLRVPIKNIPKSRAEVKVIFVYGSTGTGKSHWVDTNYPNAYKKPDGNSWFDHYNGEKELFIDEFEGWLTPSFMKQVLDRYQLPIGVKGSIDHAEWETVIVVSNYLVGRWWSDEVFKKYPELEDQIIRRISKVVWFHDKHVSREFDSYNDFKAEVDLKALGLSPHRV